METIETDIVIVGAGPAGLACAIRLAQLNLEHQTRYKIVVVEKGAYVGAHILSGCLFEPEPLSELLPHWKTMGAPVNTPISKESFKLLTRKLALPLPIPPLLKNHGNYIISLGQLCQWLAEYATELGVEIFPGFAATKCSFNSEGEVTGIFTGSFGLNKEGTPKPNAQEGIQILAQQTILAEGARGSISKGIIEHFKLQNTTPSTYGLGFKEVWQSSALAVGEVIHTVGWPLPHDVYGGSFIYQESSNKMSIGMVIGLDYKDPYLDPYKEFQSLKHHPFISKLLKNAECIEYGARAVNEGGWQSLPNSTFPGGLLVGCSAQLLQVATMKGTPNALRSGRLAGEACFQSLHKQQDAQKLYVQSLKASGIIDALQKTRNIRPAFQWGLLPGLMIAGLDYFIFKGRQPWTFSMEVDHSRMLPLHQAQSMCYPEPDNRISFNKLTNLSRSHVAHEEDQPCHLKIKQKDTPIQINWKQYGGPEQYYCPAGVYEYVKIKETINFVINAQNCLHCKTCDIKDMTQSIEWTPPEGGGGPNYSQM